MSGTQNDQVLPPRVRTRSRPQRVEPDVFSVDLSEWGGNFPEDLAERLRLMETQFHGEDWKPFRHRLIWTWRSMGVPVPEIARRLNKSVPTIHRWSKAAKEYFKASLVDVDPKDLVAERLAKRKLISDRLLMHALGEEISHRERAALVTAFTGVEKLDEQTLKNAGLYDAFSMGGAESSDPSTATASRMRRELNEAFESDAPLVEGSATEDDDEDPELEGWDDD